jgi:hypothetical protein
LLFQKTYIFSNFEIHIYSFLIFRVLTKVLSQNSLDLDNTNGEKLVKKIVLAARGEFKNRFILIDKLCRIICIIKRLHKIIAVLTDEMARKCLTDLCSEVRQRKWLSDPSYEFIMWCKMKMKRKKKNEKGLLIRYVYKLAATTTNCSTNINSASVSKSNASSSN